MSQNEKVLSYLKTHTGITSWNAFEQLGITRLSARIHDLRDKGHIIENVVHESVNRDGEKTRFVEYRLVG